ncbi:MAG TPA: response regulator [Blastocatellia bacterium]|nr:response regulator [Blastocatellia bacterium]
MPKKILVIEDSLDSRELIHLHLTTEGFAVITASNGQEGIYLASVEHPDLVITDLGLPEMDGFQVVRELRAQPEFATLPILVLTAFGRDEMDQAIKAGANRALNKPVHFDGLIDDVRELLAETNRK